GRLFGSIATGGVVGLLAWFLVGSLAMSAIFALIAFVLTMFGESIASAGGRGGSWSGGSRGSSSGGGFSGGGGSFGGGGASGRW
ncbi:MAG: YgcG family protein, partial [Bradyrhizobium sp.]|nr:YgcG family protein [Bradyrhizobium sp.]